jgi:pectate lyase-like protein/purple acid phosphatase-like protein
MEHSLMRGPRLGFGRVTLISIFFAVSLLLTVTLAPSSPANSLVGYWHLDEAAGISLDETAGTGQQVGLLYSAATYPWSGPQQTYRYTIVAANISANEPVPSAPQSLRALPSPDLTSISQVQAVFLTVDTAVIRWDTDAPSDSQIEYGTSASYGQTASLLESPVRSHALLLTPLTPNTTYHYRVISRDLAGHQVVSGDFLLTTPAARPLISVKTYGAKGDGNTDDTAAIQTAVNSLPNNATLYFPAGTYLINASQGIVVTNRLGLSWKGDGFTTVLKRHATAEPTARIATFTDDSDFQISEMAFDANGITSYGGVVFYGAKRALITRTRFFDSNKQPLGQTDRYPFVFGGGHHEDIWISDNIIEDLQLEIDAVQRAHIVRNQVVRPTRTAAIGAFSLGNGGFAEDYEIAYNQITDAQVSAGAITVDLDPPQTSNYRYSRMTIARNDIRFNTVAGRAMLLGTTNSSSPTSTNVFEDFIVNRNTVTYAASLSYAGDGILANTSSTANFDFVRLKMLGNTITGSGVAQGIGIDLRRMTDGLVQDNTTLLWQLGVYVENIQGTIVQNNKVQ